MKSPPDKETAAAIDLLQDLVARARKAGADAADAVLFEGFRCRTRSGSARPSGFERSEGQDLGLRVLVGKQQAIVSSSDRAPKTLVALVERAVAMAKSRARGPVLRFSPTRPILRTTGLLSTCSTRQSRVQKP